jgi:hypothetical protein
MSDFFRHLSDQALARAASVQPLRTARFASLPEVNAPAPVALRSTMPALTVDEAHSTSRSIVTRLPRLLVVPGRPDLLRGVPGVRPTDPLETREPGSPTATTPVATESESVPGNASQTSESVDPPCPDAGAARDNAGVKQREALPSGRNWLPRDYPATKELAPRASVGEQLPVVVPPAGAVDQREPDAGQHNADTLFSAVPGEQATTAPQSATAWTPTVQPGAVPQAPSVPGRGTLHTNTTPVRAPVSETSTVSPAASYASTASQLAAGGTQRNDPSVSTEAGVEQLLPAPSPGTQMPNRGKSSESAVTPTAMSLIPQPLEAASSFLPDERATMAHALPSQAEVPGAASREHQPPALMPDIVQPVLPILPHFQSQAGDPRNDPGTDAAEYANPAVPSRSSELAYAPVQPRELATAGPAFGAPPRTGAISPNLEPVASYASPVQTSRDPESMQVPLERQHMTARQAEAGSVVDQAGVVHATDHTGAPSSAAAIDRAASVAPRPGSFAPLPPSLQEPARTNLPGRRSQFEPTRAEGVGRPEPSAQVHPPVATVAPAVLLAQPWQAERLDLVRAVREDTAPQPAEQQAHMGVNPGEQRLEAAPAPVLPVTAAPRQRQRAPSASGPELEIVTPAEVRPHHLAAPAALPNRQPAEATANLSLHVTIGRVEIRREATPPPAARPRPARPMLSLDAYLKNGRRATP